MPINNTRNTKINLIARNGLVIVGIFAGVCG